MPNYGERWDKVTDTEKEVKQLREDIKISDKKTNVGIALGIAALIVSIVAVIIPFLLE
jgi:hypothetical protein